MRSIDCHAMNYIAPQARGAHLDLADLCFHQLETEDVRILLRPERVGRMRIKIIKQKKYNPACYIFSSYCTRNLAYSYKDSTVL